MLRLALIIYQDTGMDVNDDAHRLYFFQFPSPFPSYSANPPTKKVSFSPDVKSEVEVQASSGTETKEQLDGMIGHLEVYRSGAVKMRLANGILLDVCVSILSLQVVVDMPQFRSILVLKHRFFNMRCTLS